ncbi:hypothetical protein EVAR_22521_1 [Eumeta japonica]|uniref:Uncharacterized protein n=1 Tax=Eumeta variegata TaxID=151549 RepID=A0A4C1U789_EUMVA|nr:hypothetical protein EVAR_22521_1 [Eumeta japonica]
MLWILAVVIVPVACQHHNGKQVNRVSTVQATCEKDTMQIQMEMEKPFKGIVFSKDFARECSTPAIRYVKDGVVNESLLMVKTTENLDAATFTELTLNTLTENNIDPLVCLANAMMAQNIDENDEPFKSEYFETLDILIAELQRRFSDNDDLINSIASLDELDVDKNGSTENLGLKIPSREEASVVKAYLSRNEDIMENTLQVLYRQRGVQRYI